MLSHSTLTPTSHLPPPTFHHRFTPSNSVFAFPTSPPLLVVTSNSYSRNSWPFRTSTIFTSFTLLVYNLFPPFLYIQHLPRDSHNRDVKRHLTRLRFTLPSPVDLCDNVNAALPKYRSPIPTTPARLKSSINLGRNSSCQL